MISHQVRCRVIYGDTDTMGIAYHANYFRWFEMGRTELFRSLGMPYRQIEAQGFMLPVVECQCKYIAPVRYDDPLIVETRLGDLGAGIQFDYALYVDGADTKPKATGYTRHVFVDAKNRVVRPPKFIIELVSEFSTLKGG